MRGKKSEKDPGERIRDVCSALTFSLLTNGLQSNAITARAGEGMWAVAVGAEPPHYGGSPPASMTCISVWSRSEMTYIPVDYKEVFMLYYTSDIL